MTSVLQDWVMELSLREQGTILTAIRGCDEAPKPKSGETTERSLSAYLRYLVMNPADERELDYKGSFMRPNPPKHWKASELGHYPMHWYSHLMHAFEVVGYMHPDARMRARSEDIYREMVWSLHLNIEAKDAMVTRLTEDRIASGKVVS